MQSLTTWAKAGGFKPDSPEAIVRRAQAYETLFSGSGGREDAEIVLSDLALAAGYYSVAGPLATSESVHYAEGSRRVFLHILGQIGNPKIIGELHNAVINEYGRKP